MKNEKLKMEKGRIMRRVFAIVLGALLVASLAWGQDVVSVTAAVTITIPPVTAVEVLTPEITGTMDVTAGDGVALLGLRIETNYANAISRFYATDLTRAAGGTMAVNTAQPIAVTGGGEAALVDWWQLEGDFHSSDYYVFYGSADGISQELVATVHYSPPEAALAGDYGGFVRWMVGPSDGVRGFDPRTGRLYRQ